MPYRVRLSVGLSLIVVAAVVALCMLAGLDSGQGGELAGYGGSHREEPPFEEPLPEDSSVIRSVPFKALPDSRKDEDSPVSVEEIEILVEVHGSQGQPLKGARIVCSLGGSVLDTVSDGDGLGRMVGASPGIGAITVTKAGFYPHREPPQLLVPGMSPIVVYMIRTTALDVRVTNGGSPVPDAEVQVAPFSLHALSMIPEVIGPHARKAITGEDGVAHFSDLALGHYVATAKKTGFTSYPLEKSIEIDNPGSFVTTELELTPSEVVAVEVCDGLSGMPMSDVQVAIALDPYSPVDSLPDQRSDREGKVLVSRPVGRAVRLRVARLEGYQPASVEVLPGIDRAKLALDRTPEKFVRVVGQDGRMVTNAILDVRTPEKNVKSTRMTSREGGFLVDGWIVGQHRRFRFRRGSSATRWAVMLPGTDEMELRLLPPALVHGRVVHADDGSPLPGAQVIALRTTSPGGGMDLDPSALEDSDKTAEDGSFHLKLGPGSLYRLRIRMAALSGRDLLVEVQGGTDLASGASEQVSLVRQVMAGSELDLGKIRVMQPGEVEVNVTVQNQPLAFAKVWMIPRDGMVPLLHRRMATAGPQGRAFFGDVTPGRYFIVVTRPSILDLPPFPALGRSGREEMTVRSGRRHVLHYRR